MTWEKQKATTSGEHVSQMVSQMKLWKSLLMSSKAWQSDLGNSAFKNKSSPCSSPVTLRFNTLEQNRCDLVSWLLAVVIRDKT